MISSMSRRVLLWGRVERRTGGGGGGGGGGGPGAGRVEDSLSVPIGMRVGPYDEGTCNSVRGLSTASSN